MSDQHLSPSGKYKLIVEDVPTKPGCWHYSRGLVFHAVPPGLPFAGVHDADEPIATIDRNYAAFPFLFVEGHPRGDFLVCGADYQGQTVIELATGKRVDHLPPEAEHGGAFCWATMRYDAPTQMLIVEGCIWAAPYEFRFYDFGDPMSGWPEIELVGAPNQCVYADDKQPEVTVDDVRCFETETPDDDDDEREAPVDQGTLASVLTFRREGLRLVFVNEWVSEAEQARRAARSLAERQYAQWRAEFRATDPLYLVYATRLKDPWLAPDQHESIGITHERWCMSLAGEPVPDFRGQEQRWCRRLIDRKSGSAYTLDLEWAVQTGPIKLVVFKRGKHVEDKFFEHSEAGMHAAFDYAKELLS